MDPELPKIGNDRKRIANKLVAICALAFALSAAAQTPGQPVTFRTVGADDYQSFIGNWDEKTVPVLCAAIRSEADWNAIFHPAAFGFGSGKQKKPFGPEVRVFDCEMFLVVARVVAASDSKEDGLITITSVTANGGELTVNYSFTEPKKPASYTIKSFAGAFIPKRDYAKIIFIENGKQSAVLDLKSSQWSVPEFKASKRGAP